MNKWEALALCVFVVIVFGSMSGTGMITAWKDGDVKVSCNNLKAAAIAVSKPEPKCAT